MHLGAAPFCLVKEIAYWLSRVMQHRLARDSHARMKMLVSGKQTPEILLLKIWGQVGEDLVEFSGSKRQFGAQLLDVAFGSVDRPVGSEEHTIQPKAAHVGGEALPALGKILLMIVDGTKIASRGRCGRRGRHHYGRDIKVKMSAGAGCFFALFGES